MTRGSIREYTEAVGHAILEPIRGERGEYWKKSSISQVTAANQLSASCVEIARRLHCGGYLIEAVVVPLLSLVHHYTSHTESIFLLSSHG
jgi:hypothetical protein